MRINDDFGRRVFLDTEAMAWIHSPETGVDRKMLDRIGGEVARATSLVRYAPGSKFAPHRHGGGEEFFVLSGVFQDEHGDYPAGTYVRNPIDTQHTPGSAEGCVILVKLRQFHPLDRAHFAIHTADTPMMEWDDQSSDGREILRLHKFETPGYAEQVDLARWPAKGKYHFFSRGGTEMFVLEGGFRDGDQTYHKGAWIRIPPGADYTAEASEDGCLLYIKTGHLAAPISIS